MVLADSHRISHVPRYSGYRTTAHSTCIRDYHPLWSTFPSGFCRHLTGSRRSYNPNHAETMLVWAVPRSLAATKGITNCFLFLRLLRCFSSPGLLLVTVFNSRVTPFGNLRLKGLFAPQHSLSQLITSFIAIESQGIRQLLLIAYENLLLLPICQRTFSSGEYRSRTDDLLRAKQAL